MTEQAFYGTLARFDSAETLLQAIKSARAAGLTIREAYAPFPIPGMAQALGIKPSRIPAIALICGLIVSAGAFLLQWYSATIDYPFVVGGKPLNSWPAFLPVTFEAGILSAVLAAFFAMLIGNRLPKPYHPAFNATMFERASDDGFFLLVHDSSKEAAGWLIDQGAAEVTEVSP